MFHKLMFSPQTKAKQISFKIKKKNGAQNGFKTASFDWFWVDVSHSKFFFSMIIFHLHCASSVNMRIKIPHVIDQTQARRKLNYDKTKKSHLQSFIGSHIFPLFHENICTFLFCPNKREQYL